MPTAELEMMEKHDMHQLDMKLAYDNHLYLVILNNASHVV